MSEFFLYFVLILLPTQLGKHLWLNESLVLGRRIDYLSPTLYLTDIFLLLTLACGIIEKKLIFNKKIIATTLFISSFFLLQSIFLGWHWVSIYDGARILELTSLTWLVKSHKLPIKTIGWLLGIGVIYSSLIGFGQFMMQQALGGPLYFLGERTFASDTPGIAQAIIGGRMFLRSYSTFPHPNALGGYLSLVLPLLLTALKPESRRVYYLIQTAKWLSLIGIFLSFSRIAWVVSGALLLFILVKRLQLRHKQLIVGLLLIAALGLFIEEVTVGRFSNLLTVDAGSIVERRRLIAAAIIMWQRSPFMGVGLGQFIPYLPRVISPPFLLQPVHSIYLLVLAETGLVGVITLLVLLRNIIQRLKTTAQPVRLMWISAAVLGLFDHYLVTLPQTQYLLAVLLGMTFV